MSAQTRTASRDRRQSKAVAARRAKRRNRAFTAGGGIVIVGLLIAIVVSLINAARGGPEGAGVDPGAMTVPATATAAGAIPIGTESAPVTVDVYLDYMCPYCGKFERANAAELRRLAADGEVRLNLHVLSFLDQASAGTRYSTRAANAVATVADAAPDKILAFHAALFHSQPAEGGPGLTDDEIAALAREAGVPEDVVDRFRAGTFQPWIARVTETALTEISGTPTVKINGTLFRGDLYTTGPLTQAVSAAKDQ